MTKFFFLYGQCFNHPLRDLWNDRIADELLLVRFGTLQHVPVRKALSEAPQTAANKGAKPSAFACTDWYLVTYSGGAVVSEQYVGRTCNCEQVRLSAEATTAGCGGGAGGSTNAVASDTPTVDQLNYGQLKDWNGSPHYTINDFVNANQGKIGIKLQLKPPTITGFRLQMVDQLFGKSLIL